MIHVGVDPEEDPKEDPKAEGEDDVPPPATSPVRSPITPPPLSESSSDTEDIALVIENEALEMPPIGSTYEEKDEEMVKVKKRLGTLEANYSLVLSDPDGWRKAFLNLQAWVFERLGRGAWDARPDVDDDGPVSFGESKPPKPSGSPSKAEYIAAAEASIEFVWMRKFIDGLGDVIPSNKRSMEMLCDNKTTIAITNDPGIMKGGRHYQRKYHYICEVIQAGEIVLKKVHIGDNLADPFTKPMPYNKHFKHTMGICVCLASSLM
nr:hypothetical protein [Tanacetum cinerariifolium]